MHRLTKFYCSAADPVALTLLVTMFCPFIYRRKTSVV